MTSRFLLIVIGAIAMAACDRHEGPAAAPWVSMAEAEAMFGPLITTGNHPTPNQHGTGERVGLFAEANGTVWGLPVAVAKDGDLRVCASPAFRGAGVTGKFSAGASIIGTANAPTGWRDGTGDLELFFRDDHGAVSRQTVAGGHLANGPICKAPAFPGPPQLLDYFRLAPSAHE
ncbi:MAG TPA: hypothetical protein VGL82_04400 [Bryobacteraceae bacterium]|jgi:hypothetical protein